MGFTILENIPIPRLNINIPNVYVSLKGTYTLVKINRVNLDTVNYQTETDPVKYNLSARLTMTSGKPVNFQQPLHEMNINIGLTEYPTGDPIILLYNKAKSFFPNLTLTDD